MSAETVSDPKPAGGARRRITMADVRASWDPKVPDAFIMAWFQRPAADCVTAPFYNAGWTANGVTVLRTVLLVAAVIGLGFGSAAINLLVVVLLYVNFILDVVDGNLARLDNQASYWGKFADGLADYIYTLFVPLFAGIGAYVATGSAAAVIAGAALSVISALTHITRSRLSFFRDWMIHETGALTAADEARRSPFIKCERLLAHVSVTLPVVAPILLLLPGGQVWFLVALVGIQGPSDFIWFFVILGQANAMLRRGRTSVRAVKPSAHNQ
jgi:phosphatidylglycerophosphate synthase